MSTARSVERPLLMTGPLVVKTLAGLKTQTRRLMNPQPPGFDSGFWYPSAGTKTAKYYGSLWHFAKGAAIDFCPYGSPGDLLWIRETFCFAFAEPGGPLKTPESYLYRANGTQLSATEGSRWLPSIHMPRRASRLTLEITEVRAARVQGITTSDIIAEGISVPDVDYGVSEDPRVLDAERDQHARDQFSQLWDSINAKRLVGGQPITWNMNPWVWVLHFKVV